MNKYRFALSLAAVVGMMPLILGLRAAGVFDGPPQPVHHEERVGDLLYVIDMEQDTYKRDEKIVVQSAVTNLGDVPLTYMSGSSSCPIHVSVEIVHEQQGDPIHLAPAPLGHGCTTDLSFSTLQPGKSQSGEDAFMTRYWKIDSIPAPPGLYRVQFMLPRVDENYLVSEIPEPEKQFAGSSFTIRIR